MRTVFSYGFYWSGQNRGVCCMVEWGGSGSWMRLMDEAVGRIDTARRIKDGGIQMLFRGMGLKH